MARPPMSPSTLRLRSDRRRALVAGVQGAAAVVLPVYITAFVIELPTHFQVLLLLPVVLAVGVAALAAGRVARTQLEMRTDGVLERRVVPPDRFTPKADIASAVMLRIIDGRTMLAPRQLFVVDHSGRTRLRLREASWGADQLDAVVGRLGVPVQVLADPLTLADVRQGRPVRLDWRERSPVRAGFVLAIAMIAASALLLWPVTTTLG